MGMEGMLTNAIEVGGVCKERRAGGDAGGEQCKVWYIVEDEGSVGGEALASVKQCAHDTV